MKLPLVGHIAGRVVARSPDPPTIYLSNPDWAIDERGPLLLWDRFGGECKIELARPEGDRWRRVATFDDAMHAHLVDLPELGLKLVLGVLQEAYPKSIALWWSDDGERWRGPVELFGGADFHAGSTPWAIYEGRLHVPFEVQQTSQWGSYQYGSISAELTRDLRRPGSWALHLSRVPWSVFPGCLAGGALEGNLVAASDGQLYNLLRMPAYSRLARARWDGAAWRWLGLVQGVCNQSKPEIFGADGHWYLLANGWPERPTSSLDQHLRNTLCLWRAEEPDLSRWALARVVVGDRERRHAYSYAAGALDGDGTLWIADRHGDDETWNYHDTNCVAVRRVERFAEWVAAPALVPFGHDDTGPDGAWVKANCQDGLVLSHLDGALYPLSLRAEVRLDTLPGTVGALDLLGFATCDMVSLASIQIVDEGKGASLALSTAGQRLRLPAELRVGRELTLTLTLESPREVTAQVDEEPPLRAPTHCVSDPSLAGVLPRADRPQADLGRVAVVGPPRLTAGSTAYPPPPVPSAMILVDARGVSRALPKETPTPAENLVPGGPLVCGGHPRYFEPWAGGLCPGAKAAALWSPLDAVPEGLTLGGFARIRSSEKWDLVLAALGERSATCELRRDLPYVALLLSRAEPDGAARLGLASFDGSERQLKLAGAVAEWTFYALTLGPGDPAPVRLYAGEIGGSCTEMAGLELPRACVSLARHWLALIGGKGSELWAVGGQFVAGEALSVEALQAICTAGFVTKLDTQPPRRPSCASDTLEPVTAEPLPEPAPEPEPAAAPEPAPAPEPAAEPVAALAADDVEAELAELKKLASTRPATPVDDATLAAWEAELAKPAEPLPAVPPDQPAPSPAEPPPPEEL